MGTRSRALAFRCMSSTRIVPILPRTTQYCVNTRWTHAVFHTSAYRYLFATYKLPLLCVMTGGTIAEPMTYTNIFKHTNRLLANWSNIGL